MTSTSTMLDEKNAGNEQNAIETRQTAAAAGDDLSPTEKRRLAALKGWERKRNLEKSAGPSKKARIAPPRSASAAAMMTNTAAAPVQRKPKDRIRLGLGSEKKEGKSAASATRRKGAMKKNAGNYSASSKKMLESAKASTSSSSQPTELVTKKAGVGLSRSEAAKLGWARVREKQMLEAAFPASAGGAGAANNTKKAKNAEKGESTKNAKKVEKMEEEDQDDLFQVRSKSSKKGWETRRKMMVAAAKAEKQEMDEWQKKSKASKKGWETRRINGVAGPVKNTTKTKSLTHSAAAKLGWERIRKKQIIDKVAKKKSKHGPDAIALYTPADRAKAAKLGWMRKRKMQDFLGEVEVASPAGKPRKKPYKSYTAAARSAAAKKGWQKSREEKTFFAGTVSSGSSYSLEDQAVTTFTYTAERVEWEIRQKMIALANAKDTSSEEESEEEEEESDSEEEEEKEEQEREQREDAPVEAPVPEITRDEAASLLLAMFGASTEVAPAQVAKEYTDREIVSLGLGNAKSESTSLPAHNDAVEVNEKEGEVAETPLRGRKRKETAKGSGYTAARRDRGWKKQQLQLGNESASSDAESKHKKAVGKKECTEKKKELLAPQLARQKKQISNPMLAQSTRKTKTLSNAALALRKRNDNEDSSVYMEPMFDPQESEKIYNATAVKKSAGKVAKEMPLPRGVTVRPSGKWQAQVYYAGKSRYIGVFQNREEACYAYEIGREILKTNKEPEDNEVEVNMNLARRAAFYGVQKMRE